MHFKKVFSWLVPLAILALIINFSTSCKKTKVLTSGGQVSFSLDTLVFDTVFTQQGSATRSLKIYNKQKEDISISSIRLKNGAKSAYRLNVNGIPGTEIKNVPIAGNDSVWVFAAVTIDPTDQSTPFLVEDSLIVTLNGTNFTIPVMAYGQNAYYIRDSVLATQTWLTDKPYVIVQNALVDEGATLTIPAGARVYMHQDSRLYVNGTLKIDGTQTDTVVFQGDRLDPLVWIGAYIDIPGQWGGLYFTSSSHDNVINYAVFKNGGASTLSPGSDPQPVVGATIQVDPDSIPNGTPKLKMTNSVIRTSAGNGVLAFNSTVDLENCKIVECAGENIAFLQGGNYHIYDCTISTFGSQYLNHSQNICMALQNYLKISDNLYYTAPLTADIKNCIVFGSNNSEIFFDNRTQATASVTLSNCLIKSADPLAAFVSQTGIINNNDPLFVDYTKGDYHLQSGSPAINTGITAGSLNTDLDGKNRGNPPSIGCYEFQP